MYTHQLVTNLTQPESPEWETLAQNFLGTDVHPDRKKGFLLSRQALKKALEVMGIEIEVSELTLANHNEIVGFPELTISLSHNKNCGAAMVAERKNYRSIGIDVEEETRVVKELVKERIAHPQDINLRNIELWCLKEAVFKALMNTGEFPHPIEFSSIELLDKKWRHSPSNLCGEWELTHTPPFVVALAFMGN